MKTFPSRAGAPRRPPRPEHIRRARPAHLLLHPLLVVLALAGCSDISVTDVPAPLAPVADPVALWIDECPFTGWYDCETLDEDQVALIKDAVNALYFNGDWRCQLVRDALFSKLDEASLGNVWVFGSHYKDSEGTVTGAVWSSHLGFRSSVYSAGGLELAQTGIHEGAHLAGFGDGPAYELEVSCLQTS